MQNIIHVYIKHRIEFWTFANRSMLNQCNGNGIYMCINGL